eukprot:TRINITY_DN22208_c0_g1_i1.p1 TRINITY_DN22208_c0_g1~~TRINITY_DN22208_c0_g1_i1.p1  ORF type:complete len:1099 (+),score=130.96 TRINITY_DN22208_c0_g1_i1:41-3298(+)
MSDTQLMTEYVDALVGILIGTAVVDPDPLEAISGVLEGTRPVGREIETGEVRSILFKCFNKYDMENKRALGVVVAGRFLTDFIECFSSALVDLGPKVATTPDESWEDRSRWDVTGQELALKAKRLQNGFKNDPDHWISRWYNFIDTTKDGKGLRYAEVQNVFAGGLVTGWLSEINSCGLLADNPESPPPMSYRGRSGSVGGTYAKDVVSMQDNTNTQPEMTLNISDAANYIHQEEKKRVGFMLSAYYLCHFVLLATILTLQIDAPNTYPLHSTLTSNLIGMEFSPGRTLDSVRSIDDIYTWLRQVWAPILFRELPKTDVFKLNPLAATPYLRQKRRLKVGNCTEKNNLAVYRTAEGKTCFDSDRFSNAAFAGYEAVDVPEMFHTPKEGRGDDFAAVFPVVTVPPENATSGSWVQAGLLQSSSEAVDAINDLQAANWLSLQTAFLEANSLVYNPNLDAISVQRIVFTITDAGAVIPLATQDHRFGPDHGGTLFLTRRAVMYDSDENRSSFRLGFEIVLLVVTFCEIAVETVRYYRICSRSRSFFGYFTASPWNVYQLVFYIFATTFTGLFITHSLSRTHSRVSTLDNKDGDGTNAVYRVMLIFGGLLLILSILRVFRFVSAGSHWGRIVSRVLHTAVGPLLVFGMLYMTTGLIFAVAGHYLFGAGIVGYATMGNAMQTTLQALLIGPSYSQLSSPIADPSEGWVALIYFWAVYVTLGVLFAGILAAVFVAPYEDVMERCFTERLAALDVPSTGRPWSRRSLTFQCSNYPSMLLRYWCQREWVVPVGRRHPLKVVATAEVITGSNLRVSISPLNMGDIEHFSGILFLAPRDMIRNTTGQDRSSLVERYASVTRCRAGMEPKYYNKPNWCQYTQEWWMDDAYLRDFTDGGMSWSGAEEGVSHIQATDIEMHRRRVWLENTVRGASIPLCDETLYSSTSYMPFQVGAFRPRVLRVDTPCRTILGHGRSWERESLIFEFQDVVSPSWPSKDFTQLEVKGVYPTYSNVSTGDLSGKLVVILGDQPIPAYICGNKERQTSTAITSAFDGGSVLPYIEEMVIGRFGISSERPLHSTGGSTRRDNKSSSPLNMN